MSLSTSSSSSSMRSSRPSELPSLVVPNGARPVQPSSISHSQWATNRSVSGPPSSPKGVSTGAITPENLFLSAMSLSLGWCDPPCFESSGRHRDAGLLHRHMIALLHGRARCYRLIPAQHVGIGGKINGLPLEAGDPGPGRHVGYRIVASQVGRLGQPPVQNTVQALAFLQVALLGVGRLALVVLHEMMHLAE